ncbi:conserved hypothetical protein [Burkholderia sp. 8Y]|nr:conserved hypothetical protein [Burkholderia sp. 8Y]
MPLQHGPRGPMVWLENARYTATVHRILPAPNLRRGPLAPRRIQYRTASKKTNCATVAGCPAYHTSETIMRLFKMPCLDGGAHAKQELPYECGLCNELIGHPKNSLTLDLRALTIKLALFSGGIGQKRPRGACEEGAVRCGVGRRAFRACSGCDES